MTDEKQGGTACRTFTQQQIEKGSLQIGIKRRSRLVGNDQTRPANQRARRRHTLLLPNRQRGCGTMKKLGRKVEMLGKAAHFIFRCPSCALQALTPGGGKTTGQQDVVLSRQVRQEVEKLKDEADVISTKTISCRRGEHAKRLPEHRDMSCTRRQHASDQRKQRAFAAPARPLKENPLTGGELETIDVKAIRGGSRPTQAQVAQLDRWSAHSASMRCLGVSFDAD